LPLNISFDDERKSDLFRNKLIITEMIIIVIKRGLLTTFGVSLPLHTSENVEVKNKEKRDEIKISTVVFKNIRVLSLT